MSEHNFDESQITDAPKDSLPPINDEKPDEFGVPNHENSKEPKTPFNFRKPVGDKRDTKTKPKAKKPAPRARKGMFVEPLTQLYVGLGMTIMAVDPVCANAVIKSAENCAKSIDELAYQNEAVRRAVMALTQTSAVGGVIIAHMPILMAVMIHHVPAAQNIVGNMGQSFADDVEKGMGN